MSFNAKSECSVQICQNLSNMMKYIEFCKIQKIQVFLIDPWGLGVTDIDDGIADTHAGPPASKSKLNPHPWLGHRCIDVLALLTSTRVSQGPHMPGSLHSFKRCDGSRYTVEAKKKVTKWTATMDNLVIMYALSW